MSTVKIVANSCAVQLSTTLDGQLPHIFRQAKRGRICSGENKSR